MIRHTNFHRAAPAIRDPKERWQDQGTCSAPEHAPHRDLWFSVERDKEAVRNAQLICHDCPVKAECADWALTNRTQYGIWGGLTERQRRTILRKRKQHDTTKQAA